MNKDLRSRIEFFANHAGYATPPGRMAFPEDELIETDNIGTLCVECHTERFPEAEAV
jgi:hypothetical protein